MNTTRGLHTVQFLNTVCMILLVIKNLIPKTPTSRAGRLMKICGRKLSQTTMELQMRLVWTIMESAIDYNIVFKVCVQTIGMIITMMRIMTMMMFVLTMTMILMTTTINCNLFQQHMREHHMQRQGRHIWRHFLKWNIEYMEALFQYGEYDAGGRNLH